MDAIDCLRGDSEGQDEDYDAHHVSQLEVGGIGREHTEEDCIVAAGDIDIGTGRRHGAANTVLGDQLERILVGLGGADLIGEGGGGGGANRSVGKDGRVGAVVVPFGDGIFGHNAKAEGKRDSTHRDEQHILPERTQRLFDGRGHGEFGGRIVVDGWADHEPMEVVVRVLGIGRTVLHPKRFWTVGTADGADIPTASVVIIAIDSISAGLAIDLRLGKDIVESDGGWIRLDDDAAAAGWFIEPNPISLLVLHPPELFEEGVADVHGEGPGRDDSRRHGVVLLDVLVRRDHHLVVVGAEAGCTVAGHAAEAVHAGTSAATEDVVVADEEGDRAGSSVRGLEGGTRWVRSRIGRGRTGGCQENAAAGTVRSRRRRAAGHVGRVRGSAGEGGQDKKGSGGLHGWLVGWLAESICWLVGGWILL